MKLTGLVFVLCTGSFVPARRALTISPRAGSLHPYPPAHSLSVAKDHQLSTYRDPVLADVLLSTPELITKYGYPVEQHTVQTKDGYILTHFRIPHGHKGWTGKPGRPVILQHGILSASDLWVLMGREKSLGFILADAGYDVWLTNIRGNRHSRKHMTLSTNSQKFWNFSWHEMGCYDMPATVDYILNTTGEKKLYYIGHSMGTTMFFVMTSMKPEYNDKIRLGIALAPVAFLRKPSHQLLKAVVPSSKTLAKLLESAKIWEIFPYDKRLAGLLGTLCRKGAPTHELCVQGYYIAYGDDTQQLNKTLLPVYMSHLLAGTSTKTVLHYAQIITSGNFHVFDYGPEKNMEYYGQSIPPDYNLGNISAPLSLHYGNGDLIVNPEGVHVLSRRLPRLVGSTRVLPPKFNHIDFILGNEAKPLLFDRIMELMTAY